MKNFLNSEMPAMVLGALMEATEEVAKETKMRKAQLETKVDEDTEAKFKARTEALAKKAAERIGEEASESAVTLAAGLYYVYSSFLDAGFSVSQAFELAKLTCIR